MMKFFATFLAFFLAHAPTTTAVVRSGNGLRHRASVGTLPPWTADSSQTEDDECKKPKGRFPSADTWDSKFDCCKQYNCAKKKAKIDCRQYPVPEGLTEEKWKEAMTAAFTDAALGDKKMTTGSTEPKPGHRAVSLKMLKSIATAAKGLFKPGHKLKIVNKRFYPEGQAKLYKDLTMHDINGLVVMPLTAGTHLSFTEHVAGGKPTFFISHNWEGRFERFVASATNHFNYKKSKDSSLNEETTFYWVCTFANNQFAVDVSGPPQKGPFADAITEAKQHGGQGGDVVAIQDDVNDLKTPFIKSGRSAEYYSPGRVWCAFEYFFAILTEAPIVFNLGSTDALLGNNEVLHGDPKQVIACFKDQMLQYEWASMVTKNSHDAVVEISEYMRDQQATFKTKAEANAHYKEFITAPLDYAPFTTMARKPVPDNTACNHDHTKCCCLAKATTTGPPVLKDKAADPAYCGADHDGVLYDLCEKGGEVFVLMNNIMRGIVSKVAGKRCTEAVKLDLLPVSPLGMSGYRMKKSHA